MPRRDTPLATMRINADTKAASSSPTTTWQITVGLG
jgi:hypothetical protein